jgi:hypothetical protein
MKKKDCEHCVCLVAGKNDEWICDEVDIEIEKLETCPETI